jgi:curli biogenesis system outer membrane secretion channel CsgG
MKNISFRKLLIALTAAVFIFSGCSPQVVSRESGQTISAAQQEAYDGPKKRIAVKAFEMKAGHGHSELGQGMSDMLADALVNTNRFIVLEREHIADVIEEQDFGASGRVKKQTAASIGEIEGAQLLIRGSVVQFEEECKAATISIVGFKQACMAINLRIVDATSGRVLSATTVEGKSTTVGGGLTFSYAGFPLPVGLGAWSKTPMEKAIRECIDKAVQYIISNKL